jgi:ribonucleoside-diphosphate reductase alpha chain
MSEEKTDEVKISKIVKRDGRIVDFDQNKITEAIWRAAQAVGGKDRNLAEKLASQVVELLKKQLKPGEIPHVEQVQDLVEKVLVENGHYKTAKAYITYRKKKEEIRNEKISILEGFYEEEVAKKFSLNALRLIATRYLLKNEEGRLIEGPKQMFERVAMLIVIPDLLYDEKIFDKEGKQEVKPEENFKPEEYEGKLGFKTENGFLSWNRYHLERMKYLYDELNSQGKMKVKWSEFLKMLENGEFQSYYNNFKEYFNLMTSKKFLPNSPTLFNAGARLGQLSACFVISMEDNIESIMDASKEAAVIFKSGGGIGINYSKLRPEGDIVASTSGVASGPISFMKIIDVVTDVVKQGGKRRGANMGILESWHPDILKFIRAKEREGQFENFNISVMFDENFWSCYEKNEKYPLINPRNNRVVEYVDPKFLLNEVATLAWKGGDPGVLFLDNINKRNIQKESRGLITATNPCVTGDTRILTPYGLLRAESLLYMNNEDGLEKNRIKIVVNGEKEVVYTTVHGKMLSVTSPVIMDAEVWRVGFRPTVKLILENGMEIEVTEDHKLLTKEGWIEAKYSEGMELKLIRIDVDKIKNYGLKEVEGISLDKELGFLLGWLVGDGYIGEKVFFYFNANTERKISEYVKSVLEKRFGVNASTLERNNEIWVYISKKEIVDLFRKLMRKKTVLPEIVFVANTEFVKGFLCGLFSTDGYVDEDGAIRLNSSNKELLKETQLLLTLFGIFSKIYEIPYKRKFMYVTVSGEKREYESNGYFELVIKNYSRKIFEDKIKPIDTKNKKIMRKLKKTKIDREFVKVLRVEYVGEKVVYDFTVPGFNCYISNGVISHNCGEQPLYEYESCNLGSINLYAMIKFDGNGNAYFDWEEYKRTIEVAYRFLDNVIDVNKYPIEKIEKASKNVRRIGLGYMGLADAMFALRIPYNSEEGFEFIERVSEFLTYYAMVFSVERAKERGVFPFYGKTSYLKGEMPIEGFYHKELWNLDWEDLRQKILKYGIRNVEVTSIAPTGSISMFFDVSSGMEPQFSLVFEKRVTVGSFFYTDIEFERQFRKEGLYNDVILKKIAENGGSVQGIEEIPENLRKVFVTALDIPWWDHVRAQAVAQLWITTSISKTINLPSFANVQDVLEAYIAAYKMGCKGITIYREGSKSVQVLYAPSQVEEKRILEVLRLIENNTVKVLKKLGLKEPRWIEEMRKNGKIEKSKNDVEKCPVCGSTRLVYQAGCATCLDCSWSACVIS